ncbi:MAG: VWA domain-containing protein [Flavobacteriales bacterium]|nr:VWA domain-containing protein [Flavobacteriales bacterium]
MFITAAVLATCTMQLSAQLVLETSLRDLGTLTRADERFADFQIRNTGTTDEIIFRVEAGRNSVVKMSSKTIAAGATETIRLQYNPEKAGPFNIEARIFASAWQSPRTAVLRGEALFADTGIPCPDFSDVPGGALRAFHISLRDPDMKPAAGALVRIFREGREVAITRTDERGEASESLMPGRYLIVAEIDGVSLDTAIYASVVNDHVLLLLDRALPKKVRPPELPAAEETALANEPEPVESRPARPARPDPPAKVTDVSEATPAGDNELMPLSKFKQSNVVFLVDVSTSMKHQSRMDLLKIAMTDLLDVLRDVDRFTLISYASETNTLIDATEVLDRAQCADAIAALHPRGSTEGAKAIDKAGKAARKHFLPEGNNQIILATDGAFNEGARKAEKLVKKYRRSDIATSVLCIRCGQFTTKEMTGLAEAGEGTFIPIESADDAGDRLISEIKRSALR